MVRGTQADISGLCTDITRLICILEPIKALTHSGNDGSGGAGLTLTACDYVPDITRPHQRVTSWDCGTTRLNIIGLLKLSNTSFKTKCHNPHS